MAGTWQTLANAPAFNASTMLLLTDGSVMAHDSGTKNWWRLAPDIHGDYVQGTWTALSSMKNTRLYYASAVLKDGRVFVAGGEYSDAGGDTNTAEVYNPQANTWTSLPPMTLPGWSNTLGDVVSCTLPDGRVLLGSITGNLTAFFNPATNTFTPGPAKAASNSNEETWTLLPDQTVLTVECRNSPHAEKYIPSSNTWVSAGSTPVNLVQASSIEIGPAILMPDGRVFCIGATGKTAIYTHPAVPTQPGMWVAGPDLPPDATGALMQAKDAPACLLPNGKVLFVAGPAGEGGSFPGPTSFFEFDGSAIHAVPLPTNAGGPPFVGRMLVLPSGQALFAAGSKVVSVYTPDGLPQAAWRPTITACPDTLVRGTTYTVHGKQINGLSQANSYGDDAQMSTGYPIVALLHISNGKVSYARTVNHSTMAIATGSTIESTSFTPCPPEDGQYELVVIANGIASPGYAVNVVSTAPGAGSALPTNAALNDDAVAYMLKTLTDGSYSALTPGGPIPVDPFGPQYVNSARDAYQSIVAGVKSLRDIGRELQARQQTASTSPGPDPALTIEEQGDAGKKGNA